MFESKKFIERQLSTRGGHPTKLLNMDDSIEFMMVLPGQTAKQTRKQFCVIIKRYFAGDESMHAELDANATSSSPIAQMARESLGMQADDGEGLVGFKRRREELELIALKRETISSVVADYENMCTNTTLDEQAKAVFKKSYLDLLTATTTTSTTSSKPAPAKSQKQPGLQPEINRDLLKTFLCTLADGSTLVTKLTGRDFHKKYMEHYMSTGGSLANMLNETLFCRAMKNFPGVSKKRGQYSMVYTLYHDDIRLGEGC